MGVLLGLIFICAMSSSSVEVLACNGYEVRDFKIATCNNADDVIAFDQFSAQINEACEVVPSGAIVIKKQINYGNGSYLVEKKAKMGMPMKVGGKKDLCTLLEQSKDNQEVDLVFKLLNLDQHCPVREGRITGGEERVSVAKYKDKLGMLAGCFEGVIRGKADSGDVCIEFSMCVSKKDGAKKGIVG